VEKFFLRRFFSGDEVDVIDEEYVDAAVFFPELRRRAVLYSADELVGELLA